jgi:4-hydroxy-2-oxoheptanedioate aldolase
MNRGANEMAEIPRLNGVIKALEQGTTAFVGFTPVDVESAIALAGSAYDGIAFEMEHSPVTMPGLRDALQYMLDRRQILAGGTLAPRVTPLVRIPPNGGEMNQWLAKQVLDIGVYGIIFPHVSTVEEARNAVGACRYPRRPGMPRYGPPATGAFPSRNTTRARMCGRWRPRGRSSSSSSARRCGPSRISRGCSRRCPASAWS